VIQGSTPLARSAVSEVLVNAGLFRGIDRDAVATLTRELKPVSFRRGHTIFVEGQSGDELYIIVTGKV
jgi:CRP/FNR family cyclic AMP-dependent transcriptional regulator